MWLWFASRASGLVAQLLLTLTLLLGLVGAVRVASASWPRFVLARLHRNLSLLTGVFLVVHIATVVLDEYVDVRWIDTVVPFVSAYEPFWLGMGVVALQLMVAAIVTSLVRTRIGLRAWRVVHWGVYACWAIAVVHGLGIGGQDSRTTWVLLFTAACVSLVAGALVWRVLGAPAHPVDDPEAEPPTTARRGPQAAPTPRGPVELGLTEHSGGLR